MHAPQRPCVAAKAPHLVSRAATAAGRLQHQLLRMTGAVAEETGSMRPTIVRPWCLTRQHPRQSVWTALK